MAPKRNARKLAKMGAAERFVSGARNPAPVAKPGVRRAVMLVVSRH